MPARFEELDWRPTPMGELVLRRRFDPTFQREVYEIKLDEEYLMSSLFTVAEEEVARRSLAMLEEGASGEPAETAEPGGGAAATPRWDVLVGGLGLGFTALAVLRDARVASLAVVDTLAEVIDWHRRGLIPAGPALTGDGRCTLVHEDFFALVREGGPGRYHAVVVDIDHSPRHLLHPSHADLYTAAGAQRLAAMLRPGGVFGLWSNDPPDEDYLATLRPAFADVRAEVVSFPNPLQGREATATLYLARRG
ncbi:polyamine aminopropyltransferase [Ornithinicoccus halotolerans]|uniref:spermidine synthase n=1 Tax=Ornithinicoccus halotolerans TaxID=1748220 RepID=UPI001297FA29|nr:spermidine synthase [Ornithinicoccus halotolerans]